MAYDAFLSYARASDQDFAPKLREGLQALGKKWNKRRALSVFLDQASLEASAGLKTSLQTDLDTAGYLVVLASSASAQSQWVGEEVKHWVETRGTPDNIRIVLTDGEIWWDDAAGDFDWERSTAVGRDLAGVFTEEPLYIDMREIKNDAELDIRANPKFKDAIATLAAPMHGMSKEELVGADLEQFRRAKRLRRAAVMSLIVLTVAATAAGIFAWIQRGEAITQRDRADERAAIALSRQLAANSESLQQTELDLSLLLAIEAYRAGQVDPDPAPLLERSTSEAFGALPDALDYWPAIDSLLGGHEGAVTAATLTRDGSLLASGGELADVVVRERVTGTPVHELSAPAGTTVVDLAFSGDGTSLAALLSSDGASCFQDEIAPPTVIVWRLDRPDEPASFCHPEPYFEPGGLGLNDDGSLLAAGGHDLGGGPIAVWDLGNGRVLGATCHADLGGTHPAMEQGCVNAESLEFDPDGSTLWLIDGSSPAQQWNFRNGTLEGGSEGDPYLVTFSPDGLKGTVAHKPDFTGVEITVGNITVPSPPVGTDADLTVDLLAIGPAAPGGPTVAMLMREGRSASFLPANRFLLRFEPGTVAIDVAQLTSAEDIGRVGALAITNSGEVLGAGFSGRSVAIWNVANTTMAIPPVMDSIVAISSDGTHVATYTEGNSTVAIHELATGAVVAQVSVAHVESPQRFALSSGGRRLAVGAYEFHVFDIPSGEEVFKETILGSATTELILSPDGSLLAATWTEEGQPSSELWVVGGTRTELPGVTNVAFHPDGSQIAIGTSLDTTLRKLSSGGVIEDRVWRTATGTPSMAFNPDGSLIALTTFDGTADVEVWQAAVGRRLFSLARPVADVLGFLDTDDGPAIALGAADFSDSPPMYLTLEPDDWIEEACSIVGRNLTQAEWDEFIDEDVEYRLTCPEHASGAVRDAGATSTVSAAPAQTTVPVAGLAPTTTVPPSTVAPATVPPPTTGTSTTIATTTLAPATSPPTTVPSTTLPPTTEPAAGGLDPGIAPAGSVSLAAGFSPDPFTIESASGGAVDGSISVGCAGFYIPGPDFGVDWSGGGELLRFYFLAPDGNTTLIVRNPAGNWHCGDDSFDTMHPTVDFPQPLDGSYLIWVGTFAEDSNWPGTLHITEVPANRPS